MSWRLVLIILALFVVNAALAYRYRLKQWRATGEAPPSFIRYLFFPRRIDEPVSVPRTVRIVLGITFIVAAALMLLVLAYSFSHGALLHNERAAFGYVILALCVALFVGIGYVGVRLLLVKGDEPLLIRKKLDR